MKKYCSILLFVVAAGNAAQLSSIESASHGKDIKALVAYMCQHSKNARVQAFVDKNSDDDDAKPCKARLLAALNDTEQCLLDLIHKGKEAVLSLDDKELEIRACGLQLYFSLDPRTEEFVDGVEKLFPDDECEVTVGAPQGGQ